MAKIYIKDKQSFMKEYEKPIFENDLKERVFYREIENNKVEIKIAIPREEKEIEKVLNKILD